MSKTKHTPGPWVRESMVIWSPSAKKVVAAASKCEPSSGLVEYQRPDYGELAGPAANANLIAAAPELLATLKKCLRRLEEDMRVHLQSVTVGATGDPEDILDDDDRVAYEIILADVTQARAAIARAEGRGP